MMLVALKRNRQVVEQPPLPWEYTHAIPPIGTHVTFDAGNCDVLGYFTMEKILGSLFQHPERVIIDRMRVVSERRPLPVWIP